MNNEEENTFISEVFSEDNDNDIELQEILTEGRRVRVESEEVSAQLASRMHPKFPLPFNLKGLLGLTLGGMVTWGARSAWQSYRDGNNQRSPSVKTGHISENSLYKQTSYLPKPEPLVLRQPANDSSLINITRLDYDSIIKELLSKKLILDISYTAPNQRYYEKYIKPVFQEAILKATIYPHIGLLDKRLFKSEIIEYFRYLSSFFIEGTMMNSHGLCDLKECSLSIYNLLVKDFNDSNTHYILFNPHKAAGNLSKEGIDASKIIDIESICNEMKGAVHFLIKTGSGKNCSPDCEKILDYARQAYYDIAMLDRSDPLENLICKNILNKLSHLNQRFYREIDTRGSWGEFTFHSIQNSLVFGSSSTNSAELYTNLLIAHATIIPDLIALRDRTKYKSTDVLILNALLLDMQRQRRLKAVNFVQTALTSVPEVTKQDETQLVENKLPNRIRPDLRISRLNLTTPQIRLTTSGKKSTTINSDYNLTNFKGFSDEVIFNETSTRRAFDKEEVLGIGIGVAGGKGVVADIVIAALAALGIKGTFIATGVLGVQVDRLRGLILNDRENVISREPEQQVATPPQQPIEDWNQPGPSSRRDFIFPRISDELNLRITNSKSKFTSFVNRSFGHMDDSRKEEYLDRYFEYELNVRGVLLREAYTVKKGLELNPATDEFRFRSAKMMVAEHLDFVNAAIKKSLRLFEIILNNEDKNSSQIVMAYLIDYFKKTLNIQDDEIITEVLYRFQEVASRSSKYLQTLARNRFKNIWFASIRQNEKLKVTQREFSEAIRSLPMFSTIYAGNIDDTIIVMYPEAAHPVNPEHPIPNFRYDSHHVGESLLHEITHASSTTEDYMYFEKTLNGRVKNAKEMMEQFNKNLKNNVISQDLRHAINEYCKIYNKPIPTNLYEFFEANPRFKAYIIMNNAQSYETFFRDISEVFPYDIGSWDLIVHSKISDKNSLGQMDVLNGVWSNGANKL